MTCAGRFLSQPPMRTTASMGWARIILLGVHGEEVAEEHGGGVGEGYPAMEMVGKTMGSAPERRTPRLTESMRSSWTLPWQGL